LVVFDDCEHVLESCLARAERARQELEGPAQLAWLDRLDAGGGMRAMLRMLLTPAGEAVSGEVPVHKGM
jgi:hypothetical protein